MNKRQKEIQQLFIDNEKDVLKKLEKTYRDALAEIEGRIKILTARNDADLANVIYRIEHQKALRAQIEAVLESLHTNEFETVSEFLAKAYEDGFIGTMYDMQGQGVPLVLPIDQNQVVEAIQHETKLKSRLYTEMGHDIKKLQTKIAEEISRGISTGQGYAEIARNIEQHAKIPKNRAMTIARTESHRIQCHAASDAQYKAKEKGANIVKQWDAALDSHTRDSHARVDGEIVELGETFSNGLEYPGDPKGGADEVVNCRCALLQRARWALGNNYTRWSENAKIEHDKDGGVSQLIKVDASSYKEFKGIYMDISKQMTMNFQ